MLIHKAPPSIQAILEHHGIENDLLSHRGTDLYVDCPDFDSAYDLRVKILDQEEFGCRLITNPTTGKPTVEINNALN